MKVNLLIVGTQKGGTTALSRFLSQHPDICFYYKETVPPFHVGKEIHFFDNESYFRQSPPPYERYHAMFHPDPSQKIIGESTPNYLYWKPAAQRIYEYNPHMKLIFLLRNPVERAYSHYCMEKERNTEHLSFSDAIRMEENRLRTPLGPTHRIYSYCDRGRYVKQIKRFLQFFPMQQMLFLKTEDLRFNHNETMNIVYQFLNVRKIDTISPEIVFSNTYPTMNDSDRHYLIEIFRKDINDLENLLGWNCASWLER